MFQKVREDDMLWDGNGVIPISAAQVVVPPVSRVEVSRLSEPEALSGRRQVLDVRCCLYRATTLIGVG